MVVKNASSEIKEIFEVTGFCDILTVESSYFVRQKLSGFTEMRSMRIS